MKRVLISMATAVTLAVAVAAFEPSAAAPTPAAVDAVFAKWTAKTPGCAVGVSEGGRVVLEKAYGMADLEHDARNTSDTIFEAGSVSKQFTAMAVLLLAHDGKLSLDDPARKYVPELPDYGTPITIRHLLTHTSGLRDWGEIGAIAGWPRTSRVYTHAHVLDIVSRQRALNFAPGSYWSYCNTGYNLAAIIVARVSGTPFAEFCRLRIFQPLGMTHTSWRDDYRRVVKGRAIAYAESKDGFLQNMPFEQVHGQGGLLTTVGDLLKWNENAVEPKVGDLGLIREMTEPGTLNDGTRHDYGLGYFLRDFMGVHEVGHSGSTAGYRAYLARFPKPHVSVAVLCNVASGEAERYAHEVAALYLADAIKPPAAAKPPELPAASLAAFAGLYRSLLTGSVMSLTVSKDALTVDDAPPSGKVLAYDGVQQGESIFRWADAGRTLHFFGEGRLRLVNVNGTSEAFERVARAKPTPEDVAALAGRYASDESESELLVVADGAQLKIVRRPGAVFALRAEDKDAFTAPGLGLVRFTRDAAGRVSALTVTVDRAWNVRFDRR